MSQPTPYVRIFDFTGYQAANPTVPLPGPQVDGELNAIKLTTDQIRANLAIIQRDDTLLANSTVHPDAFTQASLVLLGGWNPKGSWLTATVYAVKDIVAQAGANYVCVIAHTGGTFATDLAAGKWMVFPATAANFTVAQTISVSSAAALTLTSSLAGATEGPQLTLDRNKGAGVAADLLGGVLYTGRSSTSVQRTFAEALAKILSPTNAAETGELHLRTINAGALSDTLVIGKAGVYTPNAVGGDQGADSINAKTMYLDGVALSAINGGFKSHLYNGDFNSFMRDAGDSASMQVAASSMVYGPDRWWLQTNANQVSSIFLSTPIVAGSRKALYINRNAPQTGTGQYIFAQTLTEDQVAALRGQFVTLSATAGTSNNFSPTSGAVTMRLLAGTGAANTRRGSTPFTGETTVCTSTTNLGQGNTGQALSAVSGAVFPANATQGEVQFLWTPTGTAVANDWLILQRVQLEFGSQVTAFGLVKVADEIARCQRFFWKTFPYGTAPAQNVGVAGALAVPQIVAAATAQGGLGFILPTRMRAVPTLTLYNPSAANAQPRNASVGADCSAAAAVVDEQTFHIGFTTAAGSSVGNSNRVHATFDADIY